jgi:hypothetical protein
VRSAVRQARPDAVLSAAVFPDVDDAWHTRLQDWRLWVENGLVDAVCPMIYTPDATVFAEQLAEATRVAGSASVWAGIGAYRLSPPQTVANITTARALGTRGVLLFSYDSMVEASEPGADYLGVAAPPSGARRRWPRARASPDRAWCGRPHPETMHAIDLIILAGYLAGTVLFGAWFSRSHRTVLPWWAIMGSIVATETSTVTFISIPGFAYANEPDVPAARDGLHDRPARHLGRSSCRRTSAARS